jgi:hypothetical protein
MIRFLPSRTVVANAGAFVSYAVASLLFHWPLPLRLSTAFTGKVDGDTGVYIWNLWVFRHEIVAHRRLPLFTNEILSVTPAIDLSLHNYTLFANLLGFPLIPLFGVGVTFNVLFLFLTALTGWTMFLLARSVIGRSAEAWLAGLLFAFSPALVARSTGHFSLIAAAPLPVFVLCLLRFERHPSARAAAALGATIAWAATCDPYYGVYCLLIGACYAIARRGRLWVHEYGRPRLPRAAIVLDLFMGCAGLVVALIGITGGTELRVLGQDLGLKSLYTPVLILTLLAILRVMLRLRLRFEFAALPWGRTARYLSVAAATCALLLSPVLYALWFRLSDGGWFHQPIFWRSGPRGVDLLAFFIPNPNHKLFGQPWRSWLMGNPEGFAEHTVALTFTALIVLAIAIWRYQFRLPREWFALTAFFGALTLGPFLHVAGVNTHIPGPWALLRYVPVVSAARMPQRFSIVLMLALAVLFGLALAHITTRVPRMRRPLLVAIAVLLAFELAPLPRSVPAAPVPDIYRIIAGDPRDVAVLGIPFGFSDGEGSEGRYSGASQYYQTFHQKPIVGGAISRITQNERRRQRQGIVRGALLELSEGKPIGPRELEAAKRAAPRFVRSARLGYVVIDSQATSRELREFVIEIFGLVKVAESSGRELYRPTVGEPPDQPDPPDQPHPPI